LRPGIAKKPASDNSGSGINTPQTSSLDFMLGHLIVEGQGSRIGLGISCGPSEWALIAWLVLIGAVPGGAQWAADDWSTEALTYTQAAKLQDYNDYK
jgi:hypothetical protein